METLKTTTLDTPTERPSTAALDRLATGESAGEKLAVGEHDVNRFMTRDTIASLDLLLGKKSATNLETSGVGAIQISKHEIPQLTDETAQPGQRYELNYQRYGQQPENCVITVLGSSTEVTMHADATNSHSEMNTTWTSAETGSYEEELGMDNQFGWLNERVDALAQPVKEQANRTKGEKILGLFVDKDLRNIWIPPKK